MSTVIYLSNQKIQVVTGKRGSSKVSVEKTYIDDAPDGTIINGIVMEPELFVGFLKDFWNKNNLPKKNVDLVISSTKFSGKTIEMPVLKDDKTLEFVKREYTEIDRNEERLFSYLQIAKVENKTIKRYVESIPLDYIKEFVGFFEEAGIKLNSICSGESAIISLIAKTVAKKNKTFVVEIADAMTLSTVLWVDGNFYYYNSVRCFHEQGTSEYAQDIARAVSQITQFMQAHQIEATLEKVVLAGVDAKDLDIYREGLMLQGIQTDAEVFDSAGVITSSVGADVQKFVYAVSGLFDDGKYKNFLTQYNFYNKQKNKKTLPKGVIAVIITFFVMMIIFAVLLMTKINKQKELEEIEEYNNSPEVLMQTGSYDVLSSRNAFLTAQHDAIVEITDNLATYPSCSKEVVKIINDCADGYAQTEITSFDADTGKVTTTTFAENVDDINKFITRLMSKDTFNKVDYTGYTYDSSREMWHVNVICTLAESVGR